MGNLKALPIEIQTDDHAQQQFGHEVRIVMAQLAGIHRLLEAMRQALLHADHPVMEDLLRLIGKPMRLGFHQPTGLYHIGAVQAIQMGQREGQQILAQLARGGTQRHRGQMHMVLKDIAQQVFFTTVITMERLLGAAGALGHRVHAQPHASLGEQRMHSRMDAAIAVRAPGSTVGTGVMAVDYTVQFSF